MAQKKDNINQLIGLSSELISLADSAHDEISDDGCLCLFGLVKDCAYRMRSEAEREKLVHEARDRKQMSMEL